MKSLLLFQTTRAVIKSERILNDAGFLIRAIPVPKEISSECGIALELESVDAPKAQDILRGHGISARIQSSRDEQNVR